MNKYRGKNNKYLKVNINGHWSLFIDILMISLFIIDINYVQMFGVGFCTVFEMSLMFTKAFITKDTVKTVIL